MSNEETPKINDKAAKRLLKQHSLSALQVGRIMFLNNCMVADYQSQLYSVDQFQGLLDKIRQTQGELEQFTLYSRLSSYSINEINFVIRMDQLGQESLKSLRYILNYCFKALDLEFTSKNVDVSKVSLDQFKQTFDRIYPTLHIDPDEVKSSVSNIRGAATYIGAYAVFYDAMKVILGDRRLIKKYRLCSDSRELVKDAESFDHAYRTASPEDKYVLKKIGAFQIFAKKTITDIERYAEDGRINNAAAYLESQFNYNSDYNLLQTEMITQAFINGSYNE